MKELTNKKQSSCLLEIPPILRTTYLTQQSPYVLTVMVHKIMTDNTCEDFIKEII